MRLVPFVDGDIIGVVRDVTQRHRSETALRESEERSALAQRAGRVGVFDWNVESGHVFWSSESEEIFGMAPGSFPGTYQSWRDRVAPEDRALLGDFFQEWLQSGRADDQCEYRVMHPDRKERWVETKGHVFRDTTGTPIRVVGTNLDVTSRRHAEKDRLILGKLESTGILAGGIAHDFNNLLAGILMDLDIVESNQCSPEDLALSLLDARHAVLSAKILTQQLVTFSRGGAAIRRPMRIGSLLRESAPLALSGSNVRCNIVVAADLWPVEIDVGQIGQVIRNLVLNAREAMPGGGVVHLRADNVVVSAGQGVPLPPGDYVRIRVVDEGCGIPPDVLPKIFDPYFSTKLRSTQKGMGLGLTICHSVVQRHSGTITVESIPGVGSKFDIFLPASQSISAEPEEEQPAPRQRSGRVLVMDDEPIVRTNLGRVLRQMGYEVELTSDGEGALELYKNARLSGHGFDAVILDLTVRGAMGGRDAVQALLAFDPNVRAIVMSGHSDDDVMRQYASRGFKGALTKPFDRKALVDVLSRVLSV
jgi:PAS domain S-box-containing protein